MKRFAFSLVFLSILAFCLGRSLAADIDSTAASDDLVNTIGTLLTDKDKDIRAEGLQQVRESAKGAEATRKFAALLPKLPAEAQIGLLDALADRGDKAARPAVLELLSSNESAVRLAALRALGSLGEPADVPRLLQSLQSNSADERTTARASITHLAGEQFDSAIAGQLKSAPSEFRAELIDILASRRAIGTIATLLSAAQDRSATVRKAAMAALGQLARSGDVGGMLQGVLRAKPGAERQAAEIAVLQVCDRIGSPSKRADPVLVVWNSFSPHQQMALLPTLGRVGNAEALKIVEAAVISGDPSRADAGIHAICNWPDATVAPRLMQLFQSTSDSKQKELLLRALTRVAVLHDSRSNAERLALLKTCMDLATNDEERNYVIKRASAVRTLDSLHFVAPYLDQPSLAQEACASVVELAHHRELRIPNAAEFNPALDHVIRICKDPVVLDKAQRYRQNKTQGLGDAQGNAGLQLNVQARGARSRRTIMPKNISRYRWLLCLAAIAAWQAFNTAAVRAENKNPELDALVQTGVQMPSGQGRRLPPPTLKDGLNAAAQKQVLLSVIAMRKGRKPVSFEEFVGKGWNAPNVLLVDDPRMSGGQPGHSIDLWFVVHGQLKTVADPKFMKAQFKGGGQGQIDTLKPADLQQRGIAPRNIPGGKEWFVHGKFELMETDVRVQVQGTCRAVDTHTGESAIVACQIDRRFDRDVKYPNDWRSVTNGVVQNNPALYYSFGGYAKVTKLAEPAGALFVEYHLVYDEPTAWFGGHQLLQSKFPAMAPNDVRSFRRDVADAESGGQ